MKERTPPSAAQGPGWGILQPAAGGAPPGPGLITGRTGILMSHLIEVRNIYKIYNPGENEVRALDGVSLTVDRALRISFALSTQKEEEPEWTQEESSITMGCSGF